MEFLRLGGDGGRIQFVAVAAELLEQGVHVRNAALLAGMAASPAVRTLGRALMWSHCDRRVAEKPHDVLVCRWHVPQVAHFARGFEAETIRWQASSRFAAELGNLVVVLGKMGLRRWHCQQANSGRGVKISTPAQISVVDPFAPGFIQ
jgi:hypothetical protein